MKNFLDSDFEVYWSLKLTKWLWVSGVLLLWFFAPMGLVARSDSEPEDLIIMLPTIVLATIFWRVFLECSMALFRIADDLRELNRKTAEPERRE